MATILLSFQAILHIDDEDGLNGSKVQADLAFLKPEIGSEQLIPYFDTIRSNFSKVCPAFSLYKPTIPKIIPEPTGPYVATNSGRSTVDKAKFFK